MKMSVTALILWLGAVFLSCTPNDHSVVGNQFQDDFLKSVNALRTKGCKCGGTYMPPVAPLVWNNQLAEAAQRHANDMAQHNFFDHQGSDGTSSAQRVSQTGYNWRSVGENIAYGYDNIQGVVAGWSKSTGHCKNMMSAGFAEMGAAQQKGYWVQTLGRQK